VWLFYLFVVPLLRPRERLRSIVMSMSVLGLSVCPSGYLQNHTCDLYQIFVHAACVRSSVLLQHVDDRLHHVSPGRGFLPIDNAYIPGTTCTILTKFFVHIACVRGSVLFRHVYDRLHHLLPGRGFLARCEYIIGQERGWECIAQAKYAIYDCLVDFEIKF